MAMTRLQSEWQRLFLPHLPSGAVAADTQLSLIDPMGRVRALVLTLGRPADWDAVSALWQALQVEWALPAPAIAVNGLDGYQLWFSLTEPVPVAEARDFLDALRRRHWPHLAPARITLWPEAQGDTVRHADRVPAQQADRAEEADRAKGDQWSAFVAPDLAPMFAETPWLDIPPSPDGQADLLSQVRSIPPDAWQATLARLRAAPQAPAGATRDAVMPDEAQAPRRFLLGVMNDSTVALALRIEAAKALLAHTPPCP